MNRASDTSAPYLPQLDGLRAFAVASVAFSHWVPSEYHFGLPWGPGGVQLFFVLSGFLITGILLRCRSYGDWKFSLRAFYARRFLRIVPIFYAVLLLAYVLNIEPVRETIVWHLTYLSNVYLFRHQDWHGAVSHFWSLAVEEQFYLFWPVVILCVPSRYLKTSVILLIATGVCSRVLLPELFPQTELLGVLPNSNFDALGLGALIALSESSKSMRSLVTMCKAGIAIYLILMTVRMAGFRLPFHMRCEHFAMLASFTWLVYSASVGIKGRAQTVLEWSLLTYLGKISYGIYVLHKMAAEPISMVTNGLGFPNLQYGISGLVLKGLFTLVIASLSWRFFETPINGLKRNFPYKRDAIETVSGLFLMDQVPNKEP